MYTGLPVYAALELRSNHGHLPGSLSLISKGKQKRTEVDSNLNMISTLPFVLLHVLMMLMDELATCNLRGRISWSIMCLW